MRSGFKSEREAAGRKLASAARFGDQPGEDLPTLPGASKLADRLAAAQAAAKLRADAERALRRLGRG